MGYDEELAKLSRSPFDYGVMTLDFCGRVFGVYPCTATGIPCYNTFSTCRSKANYVKESKQYRFSSYTTPLPFPGVRPYIISVDYLATEIKTSLTVNNRIKVRMMDDTDNDIGIDPYLLQRPDPPKGGMYWKKLLARNRYYKGRRFDLYRGFIGVDRSEYKLKFAGVLDNITEDPDGTVTLECVDLLKALSTVEIPAKRDTKLVSDIDASLTTITLNDTSELESSGYGRVGDEIVSWASKDDTTGQLFSCTRGDWDTTAVEHKAKDKFQACRHFAPANPYEHLKTMLTLGTNTTDVNTPAFDTLKTYPTTDIDYEALITEPTKLDKLYWELVNILDCRSWVNEDLKITICKHLPNMPGRVYTDITDTAHIAEKSLKVDGNEKSRITRYSVYWNMKAIGKIDEPKDFDRLDISIDADEEGPNAQNGEIPKTLFSRWIRRGNAPDDVVEDYIECLVKRYVANYVNASPLIPLGVELKDSELRTGDYLRLTTGAMQDIYGNDLAKAPCLIVKKEPKEEGADLVVQRLTADRICYFAPEGTSDYDEATDDEKEFGFFCDEEGFLPDATAAYTFY